MSGFMKRALRLAKIAGDASEVPVAAVVVRNGIVISQSENRVHRDNDPTAHAEILALSEASRSLEATRLVDCDLYVTLEPCAMCAGAIAQARIRRLYFGAFDPKGGAVEHGARVFDHRTCNHRPEVIGGLESDAAVALLQQFFANKRG